MTEIIMIEKITSFIKTDIWSIRLESAPPTKSFFVRQLRLFLLTVRGFQEHNCKLRASALTFYSLLSVVPVVALAFGISKGFGFEKNLEKQLIEKFPGQEEVLVQVVTFARSLLEETKGGIIAGIGVAVLFYIVIKLLSNIERSFNDIWGIKKSRSIGRKLSDYLSIMLICPLLIIMSSSTTVFIKTQIVHITERFTFFGVFSPFILFLLKLLPYFVIGGVFAFMYIFMPNTKVKFKSGIIAGAIAGTVYQLAQLAYINFQVGVAKYNAIYGSFAALPLFLIWLQLSWLIVLFGAEISFIHQNAASFEFESECLRISSSFKRLLSLRTAHVLIKNFSEGQKPLTSSFISRTLEIPINLMRQILDELVESGVASEIKTDEDDVMAYQPAKDINILTIKYIINSLDKRGSDNIPVAQTKELQVLAETLKTFNDTIEKSPENKLLRDI
ncbi:MAG: YihY/virulence factor BrkB family protein [Candidatus Scalindua sp.]|nr:YihY/virulence factor BrkB family protein [Candidatus Scalindua sp.]